MVISFGACTWVPTLKETSTRVARMTAVLIDFQRPLGQIDRHRGESILNDHFRQGRSQRTAVCHRCSVSIVVRRSPSDERLVDDGNPQAVALLVEGYLFRRPRMQSGLR